MDFYEIKIKEPLKGPRQVYPDWVVGRSKDLMVRGKSFYAVWDEQAGLWSTDEYDVQRLVDADLHAYAKKNEDPTLSVMNLRSFQSNIWTSFRKYMQNISDNHHLLDNKLAFANTEVKKSDYISRRLPYALGEGDTSAWDELLDVLYSPDEKDKIEWAIGSVVAGDAKTIQKFLVFYGPAGSGKSTILNIIQKLFEGYVATFDAKALGSNNGAFSTEVFRNNPLVAIQHDGDLSRIEDNTKLNSIISHEEMTMNEKFKPSYSAKVNALLFMGTNQPVKISDAKSGIIRRLIDVHPTGAKIENERYNQLITLIDFELGAIAHKCWKRYLEMGKGYYNSYRPIEMMAQTDVFYNFVESYFDIFKAQDGTSLKQAWDMYKQFCEETGIQYPLPQYKLREELRNYFHEYHERYEDEETGERSRSYYKGFKYLQTPSPFVPKTSFSIDLSEEAESYFDRMYGGQPAQYARPNGYPGMKWERVTTTLSELDTAKRHWVKVPANHIVIDFDLVDEDGNKDLGLNLEAAAKWPPTYTEISSGGNGLHLHYIYTGDVHELSPIYDVGIEVKTLLGDSSLRRQLTRCNSLEVAQISSGLPLKEKKKDMLTEKSIASERGLRDIIDRNLRKEVHPGTKPSIDFIYHILDDAYESGLAYDVSDLKPVILTFAAMSTNQSETCVKIVQKMKFVGQPMEEAQDDASTPIVFFDVEVYPNLFVVCWKYRGGGEIVKMINPSPQEIEQLLKLKLVGFYNRRYDNHILYARYMGYTLEELYHLSAKLIDGDHKYMFGEAYNLSYTDIWDFSSKKQGLKKFEIELGLHHMELDIPWHEPVPENLWDKVIRYCENDVIATEAVFEHRYQDFVAREILAELSGLSVNHTTQQHTAKIIFGDDKNPQSKFVYTDLGQEFEGYYYEGKDSFYRGEDPGSGGYVYAEPGIYEEVALLDVASMHPTSIEVLNLFGPYTSNFSALKSARMAIKHKEYETARLLLDGKLRKFLDGAEGDPTAAEALSYALKIVINIVYGLTSASFSNAFKDNRNKDNIVAKRGALFMIDLKYAVQEKGFTVAHIKTDSIKIPGATPEIINFVMDFGKQYGYDFEHEGTYDKFCLVNDAVYIAREGDKWTAVGAQFQHPYVYKELFTHEPIEFDDLCETKNVAKGTMYLDFSEIPTKGGRQHVGRTGSFVPVLEGGGALIRVNDDKEYAVTGTKGYRWIEREMAQLREPLGELHVDMSYFEALKKKAVEAISEYGSFEEFVS